MDILYLSDHSTTQHILYEDVSVHKLTEVFLGGVGHSVNRDSI